MKLWSGCGFCWGCFSHFMGPSADDYCLRVASYPPPSTLSACGFSAVIPHLCMPQAPPVVPDLSVRSFPVKCSFFPSILTSFRWKKGCVSNMMFNADGLLQWFCHILNLSDHGVTTWRDGPCCPLKKRFEGAVLGLLDNPVYPGLSSKLAIPPVGVGST